MAFNLPFFRRLHPMEYLGLLASILILLLELLVRIITLALPPSVISFFYRSSRKLYDYLYMSSASLKDSRGKKKAFVRSIAHASDFEELCELHGYACEEHVVQTKDGYLLGLHRLAWRKGEEGRKVNSGPSSLQKKVVFCMHGLLMNSEVWVCMAEKENCLAFQLVDRGYDVWLGNNRGNKYSKKSTKFAPTETRFWSFSIDQFAFHDIPDSINYILETTGQPSLSYLGFSQGTAQAFASLSIHPTINGKVDVLIALAPAMAPPGLSSGLVNSLMKASPNFLFLLFGRRAILSSATMWEAILYPPIFVRLIDLSLSFLFGWKCENISPLQKLAAYPHLYSFSSTKSIVHWFQIIRNGKFQMYDDDVRGPFSFSDSSKYYKVAKFPTRNIKTPIVLVYGGSDSLVDIDVMLKELPKHTQVQRVPHYEHLDFLWAADVEDHVHPVVFEALEKSTASARSESDAYMHAGSDTLLQQPAATAVRKVAPGEEDREYGDVSEEDARALDDENLRRGKKHPQPVPTMEATHTPNSSRTRLFSATAHVPDTTPGSPPARAVKHTPPPTTLSQPATDRTINTSSSRPEGWWSSDDDDNGHGESTATPVDDASASAVDVCNDGAGEEVAARAVLPAYDAAIGGRSETGERTRRKKKKVQKGED